MKAFLSNSGIAIAGLVMAGIGYANLNSTDGGVRHHRNPFAIQQSGYGMTLARLSQDTVNTVWHLGVEQVNPETHVHGPECAHLPGHGGHGHDEEGHDGHDHGDHASHSDEGEEGHVHGPWCDHDDHGADESEGIIVEVKDWLLDQKAARYARTNPYGMSELHRLVIARDIESTLLRSYRMDPTNYGVYNAYFLFLTIHELRATPRARDHARQVSKTTIAKAFQEETSPAPWLTAANAVLNLFFLDQEDWRSTESDAPKEVIEEYRQKMGYCLQQYSLLKAQSIHAGRWEELSPERQQELDEREQFSNKAFGQFAAMLARIDAVKRETLEGKPVEPGLETGPVTASSKESDGARD